MGEEIITRREFIRNFRKYQDLLSSRKIYCLRVPIDAGNELEIRMSTKGLTGKDIASFIRNRKKPITIKRPDFDLFE